MRRNFAVLLSTSFIGDIVSPIFALYLPLFAYQLGASVLELGLVGGLAYASYSFMPFVIGRYSDRVKRRKDFMTVSLALLAACSVAYVFVGSPVQIVILRVLEGVGWATLWPVIDVEVSQEIHGESSRSFSIYNTVWSIATAVGPLVATAMIVIMTQVRYIFAVTALLMIAAAVLNGVLMKRDEHVSSAVQAPETEEGTSRRTEGRLVRSVWTLVVAMIFVSAVRGVLFTFYPPLADSRGASYVVVGLAGFSFGAARFFAFALTTRDAFRRFFLHQKNIMGALIGSMAVCAVAALLPVLGGSILLLGLLSFVAAALANSIAMTICQVELITRADPDVRGRAAGTFESSIGIGIALGPVLSGFVPGSSLSTPFLIVPLGFVAALVVMLALSRNSGNRRAGSAGNLASSISNAGNRASDGFADFSPDDQGSCEKRLPTEERWSRGKGTPCRRGRPG